MRGLIFILFIMISTIVNGQTAYKGGTGDGYSSTGLVLQTVGIEMNIVESITIYPSVLSAGQSFKIEDIDQIQKIFLMDINGNKYPLRGTSLIVLPDQISSGIYTIWLENAERYYVAKLVVID